VLTPSELPGANAAATTTAQPRRIDGSASPGLAVEVGVALPRQESGLARAGIT